MLLPTSIKAQNDFVVKLQESFESGAIPSTWTQEYVEGEQPWQVESLADYQYPANKIPDYKLNGGGSYRAYLRNSSGQTIGYKTKLVSPAMDLTGVYRPILRFYHAQDKWTADFDTLRVFYRADPEDDWLLLDSYERAYRNWQSETIELPNFNSKAYQIAFEGSDNMGRGIVLDSIVVRSYPECTLPTNITLTGVANGQATISWHASWDADQFHVVLTTKKAEMDTLGLIDPAIIAADTLMEYDGNFTVTIKGLKANTTYYVYIQSICGGQTSEWAEPQEFTMAFRESIPYTETFDMPYTSNNISAMQLESWTWGGNYQPVIDLWISKQEYDIYSRISDPAVLFNGNYLHSSGRFTTPIPANGLAYLATPELTGEDLKDCQIRFWATMAQRHNRKQANAIIVAVATDASDYTTFTPIDTIVIETKDVIEEYTVSFEKYSGEGKYVVFVSYFDKPNQFYIDEVTIEKRPAQAKPDYQTFHFIPGTTTTEMWWSAPRADVQSYNIIVAKDLSIKKGELVIVDKALETSSTSASVTLSGLQPWTKDGYYVSIQAVYAGGNSEWSEPRQFFTSAAMSLPMHFGFEDSEGYYTMGGVASVMYPDNIMMYSTNVEWPHNTASSSSLAKKEGDKFLYLNMDAGKNSYIVFPMVDSVQDVQINFYLNAQTAANKPRCLIELGVMTEPANLNTFVKVGEYRAGEKWARCYGNFIAYQGKGKYIAMRWMEPDGQSYSTNYIDDVTISQLVACPMPTGFDYIATDTSAVLSWNKGAATAWNVKVSSVEFDDAELTIDNLLVGDMFNGKVTEPTITVTGLDYSLPYYVYLQAECDGTLTEWTSAFQIKTECPEFLPMPYVQDFNGAREGGVSSSIRPACWYWGGNSYQYLTTSYDSDSIGPNKGCLYLRTHSASEIGWVAMPATEMPVQDVMVVYDYYSSITLNASAVYVGVMTDPNDFSTFEVVDSVIPTTTSTWYKNNRANFLKYTGNGKHIAFTCGPVRGNTYVLSYLDYIRVMPVECQTPDIWVTDIGASEMTLHWEGKLSQDAEGWEYAVATRNLTKTELGKLGELDSLILIAHGVTTLDSVHVSDLNKQTTYYLYVHGLCGDKEWASTTALTECATIPANGRYVENFESYGKTVTSSLSSTTTAVNYFKNALVPECWTVGNLKGTDPSSASTYSIRNYYPYVFSNGGTSATAYYDQGTALTTAHYSNSGCDGLKIYGYYSSTASSNYAPAWAAMPRVEAESDEQFRQIVVKGSYQMATTKTYALLIGVMDDPTDLSTFVVIDSLGGGGLGTGVGKDIYFEVPLENYTGTGRYIAFRTPYGVTTTAFLDDIVLDGTACYQPQSSLSRLTDKSIRLTAGMRGQTDWIYYLTDKEASDEALTPDGVNPVTKQIVVAGDTVTVLAADTTIQVLSTEVLPYSTRVKSLSGMKADTKYYISVAAACDPANGLYSQFAHLSFTTLCSPAANYKEDFESVTTGSGNPVPCWTVGSNTASATTTYIPYVNNTSSYRSYGEKYLYLYSTTTYQGAYAISPMLDVEDITKKQLLFYARSSTSTSYAKKLKVGVVTDPMDLSTVVILDTIDIATTEGCRYLVSFADYKGDLNGNMGKHVIFLSEFNATNQIGVGYVEIQDIPACAIPTKFGVDSLTSTEAALSWNGNSDKYRLVVTSEYVADTTLNKGGKIKNLLLDTIVEKSAFLLENLRPVTEYYAHVAGICGTDTTDFDFAGVSFKTECPAYMPLPYSENFDSYPSGGTSHPDCWKMFYNGLNTDDNPTSTIYPYVYSSGKFGDSGNGLYMYTASSYNTPEKRPTAATPRIGGKISDAMVSFKYRTASTTASYTAYTIVGVAKDVTNLDTLLATFIPVDTISSTGYTSPNNVWYDYIKEFSGIDGENMHVVLMAYHPTNTSMSYHYIDNFIIEKIPSCFVPTGLKAENASKNTIDLHFLPGKDDDSKWEVALWDSNADDPDTIYQIVDTVDCVLTGLASSTVYNIAVRTLCPDNEKSEWSESVKASTLYEIDTYTWTFSGSEFSTLVEGSTSYYLHPALTPGSNQETNSYTYKAYRTLNTGTASNGTYVYGLDTLFTYNDNSRTGGAMRLYTTSTVDTAYVILPSIINPGQKQITFDVRGGYAYSATSSSYSSTYDYRRQMYYAYSPYVVVGTFDEGKGLESFKQIYEMRLPMLRSVSVDPVYPDPDNTTDKHGEYATAENNYLFEHVTVPVPEDLPADKRIVLLSVFSRAKSSQTTNYAYVDNLKVEAKSQAATPQIKSTGVTDTTITVKWDANGNTAWDILVFDSLAHFSDTLGGHFVRKIENITSTSYTIEGLKERTTYYLFLSVAGKTELGYVSARQQAKTMCTPLPDSTLFDFEDDIYWWNYSSTTKYPFPNDCWSYGLNTTLLTTSTYTYWPRLMENTDSYKYSRNGKYSLRFYTSSSASNQRAYVIMPYMDVADYSNKELVFYLRDGYEQLSGSSKGKMSVTNSVSYDNTLVIGMVDDPEDFFGTFTPIDTVHYSYGPDVLTSSTMAASDPNGDNWWEKKIVPLKSGHGNYVAFYKPGYHAGEYIDDVKLQVRQTALAPTNLRALTEATSAQLSWYPKQTGTGYQVQICADNKFETLLADTVVTNTQCTFNGFTPNTRYFWRVKHLGTPYGDSEFANAADFWTECVPVVGAVSTSFERDGEPSENYRNYTSTLLKNQCWTYDNAGTTKTLGTSYPYNIPSTATVSYALSGDYALKMYASSTTYIDYVITPRIEGIDFDTMQVTFWITPCPHGIGTSANKDMVSTAWSNTNAAQVEVGTCTDPTDPKTFVVIDTVKYSRYTVAELKAKAPANIANDYTYQKFTLPLAGAVGPYVYMRAVFDKKPNVGQTSATSSTTIYIDNFSVEPLQVCASPSDISAKDVLDSHATLYWSHGDDKKEYRVQVSDSYLFDPEDLVVDTVITDSTIYVDGLKSATIYYARLKMTCVENGVGDWSQSATFRTAEAPYYHESFKEATQLVDGWMFTTGLAKDIFAGGDFTTIQTSVPSSTSGWYSANQNEALSGAHYAGRMYTSTSKWWMISPMVILNDVDTALLSFKMNYVLYNANWSSERVWRNIWSDAAGGTGYDDQFMVIISDDGGKTWKRENAIVWNNEKADEPDSLYFYGKGDYSLNGIKFLGNNVTDDDLIRIDLSKYQGKAIKIAFYVESTVSNTANVIHIDEIHVNYVDVVTETNNICQYEDYESMMKNDDGEALFVVNGDNVEAGEFTQSSYKMSLIPEKKDTILALSLNVTEAPQVVMPSDTICEGETFSGYEFNPVNKTGVYKKKLTSVAGCDSITSFFLYVTPRVYANAEDTICQGQTYNFNGKTLNRSGLYVDTLQSFVTGCDSVINFVLFVRQPQGATEEIRICHGSTYQFGDTVIATPGLYTRHFITATGCDSIATINVTVLPEITDTIRDFFCPGSVYEQYGFNVTLPGLYRQQLTSVDGCDSTVVLILEHYSTDTTRVEHSITTEELPFTYESLTYGVNTLPGTYIDTINVQGDGCDAVVIHTLIVTLGNGLDDIRGSELRLAPSVINVGETVSVIGKFTQQQMKNMTLEIFDMTGKRVSVLQPKVQPVVIGGFYQTGIYNIRIVAGDDTTYNGRVVVK